MYCSIAVSNDGKNAPIRCCAEGSAYSGREQCLYVGIPMIVDTSGKVELYPFTAPAITPEIMNFWQARYRITIGIIAKTSMAIMAPISTEP